MHSRTKLNLDAGYVDCDGCSPTDILGKKFTILLSFHDEIRLANLGACLKPVR